MSAAQPAKAKRVFKTPPTGRPTVFTPEKQDSLIDHLTRGGLMPEWCKRHRIDLTIVFNYMRKEVGESFHQRYLRAREDQACVFVDQTLAIADEKGTRRNPLDPQRQKLRVETRMRIAGLLNRKAFGTRPEDAALNGRLTLGELVEAAVRHGAQLAANGTSAMLDVTPGQNDPSTDNMLPSADALARLNAPSTERSTQRPRRRAAT